MIGWLLTTRIGRSLTWLLAGAVAMAAALFGAYRKGKAQAKQDAKERELTAKVKDHERADNIRKRADAARADADRELDAAAFLRKHNRLRDE